MDVTGEPSTCPSCGAELQPHFQFCDACGAPISRSEIVEVYAHATASEEQQVARADSDTTPGDSDTTVDERTDDAPGRSSRSAIVDWTQFAPAAVVTDDAPSTDWTSAPLPPPRPEATARDASTQAASPARPWGPHASQEADLPSSPLPGAWPLIAFGVLIALTPFLPFASVNGVSDHEVDASAVVQMLVLGTTAVLAGIAGLRGSTAGLAAGAGVVTAWTVLLILIGWFVKLMFVDIGGLPGVSVTPHAGFVAYLAATVVGVVVAVRAIPALKLVQGTTPAPALLGWAGLAAGIMWTIGTVRQAQLDTQNSFQDFWSGEVWIDVSFVALLAGPILCGLVFAARPTGATGAFFFGFMVLPAVIWFIDKVQVEWTSDGVTVRQSAEHPLTTIGVFMGLGVGLVAAFAYACRRTTVAGVVLDRRRSLNGAFIAAAMVVGIALAYGLIEDQNRDHRQFYDDPWDDPYDDGW